MTNVSVLRKPTSRQMRDRVADLRAQVDTRRSSLISAMPDAVIVGAFDAMPSAVQRYFFKCGPGEALRLLVTFVEVDTMAKSSVVWGD